MWDLSLKIPNPNVLVLLRHPNRRICADSENFQAIWKQIMPAAVESCRGDWKHKQRCEYLEKGRVPLSLEPWESSICSCGNGKDLDGFPTRSFAWALKGWATRVAIPTLSAVSYVEAMDPSA